MRPYKEKYEKMNRQQGTVTWSDRPRRIAVEDQILKTSERRSGIIDMLRKAGGPIAAKELAAAFQVSRQVIVQDMALLRAQENNITSTNVGYFLLKQEKARRVFKVMHTDEQVEEELSLIVDYGGVVEDVFIYHKVYGIVRADLQIRCRKDIEAFLQDLATGKSGLLKNVTSNYHYHTVSAPTEKLLDLIQQQLMEKGFLAKLQDYEPVNFWE